MEILLPPWITMAKIGFRYVDSTGVSRGTFTGKAVTAGKGGDRLAASLEFAPKSNRTAEQAIERAALISFLARLRGRQNRAYLFNPANRLRGSFPATELLANNTFAGGTTGWTTAGGTAPVLTVADRVLRSTLQQNISASTDVLRSTLSPGITVTQYAPHVMRAMTAGANFTAQHFLRFREGVTGTALADSALAAGGLFTLAHVPSVTSVVLAINAAIGAGSAAGQFLSVHYTSLSRCALVDNGPNQFTQSDAIDHADWTKVGVTVIANALTDHLGSVTADRITEDTSVGGHSVLQDETKPAAAEDWCIAGAFRQGNLATARGRVQLRLQDTGTVDFCAAIFDLIAGTVVNVTNTGVAANARAVIRSLGNSWWYCALVGTTDAETTVRGRALLVESGTTVTYAGVTTGDLFMFRLTLAKSGVPVRLTQTTTTTDADGTAQTGSAMHVKGLPASTNGLLLPGDEYEVITSFGSELKIAIAPLNSDAAGLGYFQFEPPLRGTVADNAPIIIHQPMGRFLFNGDLVGWDHEPGIFTRASAEFEEA